MTKLSIKDKYRIYETCKVGTRLEDALRLVGLHGDPLTEAMHDPDIARIAAHARAEGAAALRSQLATAAASGNVSAARILARDAEEPPAAEDRRHIAMTDADWKALCKRVQRSVNEAMEKQRQLLESADGEG